MKRVGLGLLLICISLPGFSTNELKRLNAQVEILKAQTQQIEKKLHHLQQRKGKASSPKPRVEGVKPSIPSESPSGIPVPDRYHTSSVTVHSPDIHPESLEFYPTALLADEQVITYIAGTPVISAPYLGARPAFDGSDYIVNISSINRDLRLMQQRRNLYRGYQKLGYPPPDVPIIALSGKIEPVVSVGQNYFRKVTGDLTLGSDELDVAAILNDNVEAYMGIAYDASPPQVGGQRIANSLFSLNMGFVNVGNLDKTPLYFTVGQIFVPFGRYSSAMVSATLPMILTRTKSRPLIIGYKSQEKTGPMLSLYGFRSDTNQGQSGVGGVNGAYIFEVARGSGEIGAGFISSIADSTGMQYTGSVPGTTFGGFASLTNGRETVRKTPGANAHANISVDRYSLTAEWVGATEKFRLRDLSFNGHAAQPQAAQIEAGMTFRAFDKPSSLAVGYQWTSEALALNLPKERFSGVFNISIWKDTIESLEYRHDIDYKLSQYANGANAPGFPPNRNTVGSGKAADMLIAQVGVFF